jgi:DNA-binding PadR family transcriptional regulator
MISMMRRSPADSLNYFSGDKRHPAKRQAVFTPTARVMAKSIFTTRTSLLNINFQRRTKMSVISEYQLTHCSMKLLAYLFYYRGMTALQLSQMYYESEKPFPTQKSSVHNYLSKLKKQNLVASKKLEDSVRPGSLYYLTPKGLEAVKEILNIEIGATENGFILLNEQKGIPTQSDLPYSLYQPPKQQIQHHLLLIDFFIRLRIHFFEEESVDHRLSMYCSTPYTYNNMDGKIRPDAEIILPNGDAYWLEVDRSTESHSQLLAKFQNYKNFLSYLEENNLPIPFKGIIFLADEKQQMYGMNRRWMNILSAYLKSMDPNQAADIRLLMTPLNRVEKTLRFEMKRVQLNKSATQLLHEKLHQRGYHRILPFIRKSDQSLFYAIAMNKKSYKIFYVHVSNAYDSSLYTNFHQFIQRLMEINQKDEVKQLQPEGVEQIVFHLDQTPYIIPTLHGDHDLKDIEAELEMLSEDITFIQLDTEDV